MLNIQQIVETDNKSDIADSYIRIGRCYQQKLMPSFSLTFYEQALELHQQVDIPDTIEQKKIADLHWRIGRIYQNQQDWNSCIKHYESSLRFLPILKSELIFDLYSELGLCYQKISDGEAMAINYYKKALEMEPYRNSKITYFCYQIGLCYQELEEFSDAFEYFVIALEESDEQAEDVSIESIDLHAQIGFCACYIENWSLSIEHCSTALGIYRSAEIHNIDLMYRLYTTIAHCFGQQKMYASTIEYFDEALKIQEDENNLNKDKQDEKVHLNNQLGFCYFMSSQYDVAYWYFDKSINAAKNSILCTSHSAMIDNYEMLGHIYVHYNDKVLANNCFVKALNLLSLREPIDLVRRKRIRDSLKTLKYDKHVATVIAPPAPS